MEMMRLYLYLGKRDKAGIKVVSVLQGPKISAKVNNVKAAVDTYIRMKVNPDLLIEGENAKKLGLIACSKCKNQ